MIDDDAALRCDGQCGDNGQACVFRRALLARSASCHLAGREPLGERAAIVCRSPAARRDCAALAALLHRHARAALRLPRPGPPLLHVQATRLHCGGLTGLRQVLETEIADVHRLIGVARERHGSLDALPWRRIVAALVAWQPRRAPHR